MTTKTLPQRKSIRLKHYDYSQNGAYFITVRTQEGRKLFGEVVGRDDPGASSDLDFGTPPYVALSPYGVVVDKCVNEIATHYNDVTVDTYCVMPNHLHMIITVARAGSSAPISPCPANALIPTIVAALKKVTNGACGISLWQTSYHDRIIRDEKEYLTVWEYIETNPLRWELDRYYA